MAFYVYQYIDESGSPYYIGKGSGRRIHVNHTRVQLPPVERRIIIKDGLTNHEAKELEKELITKYGRKIDGGILDNIKINQWACFTGWTHSEQTKQKISKGNLGKTRSEEQKKNYKGTKTPEHAAAVSQAVKTLWDDPAYKKAQLDKVEKSGAYQKISEKIKQQWADPEYKAWRTAMRWKKHGNI
jgi:hypothetical protein